MMPPLPADNPQETTFRNASRPDDRQINLHWKRSVREAPVRRRRSSEVLAVAPNGARLDDVQPGVTSAWPIIREPASLIIALPGSQAHKFPRPHVKARLVSYNDALLE
jgi:hypothetical protein